MSKIRIKYWIILSIWLLIFAGVFVSNLLCNYLNFQDVGIILAGVSVSISLLALGFADPRKPRFSGYVEVWNKKVITVSTPSGPKEWYHSVKMEIVNKDSDPIQNFTVSIRAPNNIIFSEKHTTHFRKVRFGVTSILIFDTIRFLGIEEPDNFIRLEPAFSLDNWGKGNIYLTISGDNISPTTFAIKTEQKEDLINSKPSARLKLKVYE